MMVEKEHELIESKISSMMSQIQPHFMFNTLSVIKYLCKKDPSEAAEAIDEFSVFLRASTDSVNRKTCVTFEEEMELVKNYLALEKRRFGDKLEIVYDIKANGFLIPALSIQPIVENAVKYGIRGKIEGGTLIISVDEDDKNNIITVIDDEPIMLEENKEIILQAKPDADITIADNYIDALRLAEKESFDVAFLDIEMPGMSGIELAKKLKDIKPYLNIIFVTAYTDYALEVHSLYVSGYLLKPIKKEDVVTALDNLRNPIKAD